MVDVFVWHFLYTTLASKFTKADCDFDIVSMTSISHLIVPGVFFIANSNGLNRGRP